MLWHKKSYSCPSLFSEYSCFSETSNNWTIFKHSSTFSTVNSHYVWWCSAKLPWSLISEYWTFAPREHTGLVPVKPPVGTFLTHILKCRFLFKNTLFHAYCVCVCVCVCVCMCSVMSDSFKTHRLTVAHQAPLSIGFTRQEYWSELPFPTPWYLPGPGINLESLSPPALAGGFSTTGAMSVHA